MLTTLRQLWYKFFPSSKSVEGPSATTSSKNLATPVSQAPVSMPAAPSVPVTATTPSFVYKAAHQVFLDSLWENNNRTVTTLAAGTKLWHGGMVGPDNPALNTRGLWTTCNAQSKEHYNAWAADEAKAANGTAYLTEFETNKDLPLADFNSQSLSTFTMQLCNYNHNFMKQAVMTWVKNNSELRGIIAANSNPDEVIIGFPQDDLNIVKQTPV